MKDIVIATGNINKVKEYKEMLEPLGYTVKSLSDFDPIEIIEDGNSFEENALIKAKTLQKHTGLVCIADDSGLEIEALDNRPGIYSARWLGEATYREKNEKILELLQDKDNRKAKFTCVIAYVSDEVEKTFKGELFGEISQEIKGENGFGYDPIFYVPDMKMTNAEMTPEVKNSISHRGQATRKFLEFLKEIG